jgi:hypothetical protein
MERKYLIFLFLVLGSLAFFRLNAGEPVKRLIPFDDNWYFRLEIPVDSDNKQNSWTRVDIPHDWSVELPFVKNPDGGIATGHKAGGTAWYRKNFTLADDDANKLITLCFDGVYMESEIWLNGKKVFYHSNGYTPFRYDITACCNPPGVENELKVKVANTGKNSRWYSGSGIYRHIWLMKTGKLHLDIWHTAVITENASDDKAIVAISTEVLNATNRQIKGELFFEIYDPSGKKVNNAKSVFDFINNNNSIVYKKIVVNKPQYWSLESPALYKAKIYTKVARKITDAIEISFGIRIISFSAKKGFQLNGKTIKLKGGCIHHDNGLLGAAAIDRAEIRKVELLKSNGFNAVRCAHNPPSEQFLDACDSLGLLVIDEAFDQWQKPKNPNDYHRFFDKWSIPDVESMVRRDRNHPSVMMWSIGNEIQERADSAGMLVAAMLKNAVRALDKTRPVTAAVNEFWDNPQLKWKDSERAFRNLDVCGYNYMWREYENDHRLYPQRVIFGSESTAMERAVNWNLVESNPYIIGDFVWTAMDYLGESGIGNTGYYPENETNFSQFMDYPWFNSWCGDIDICGNCKPQALYRDVVWRHSPIEMTVHAPVPDEKKEKISYWGWPDEEAHWNWNGLENKMLNVRVFSRDMSVRLYLNNRLLEEKKIENADKNRYTATFRVPYQPGTLKAVGMTDGKLSDSITLTTTGEVKSIRLKADRNTIRASRNDLSYVIIELVDNKGNVVPDEDVELTIRLKGEGNVIAGNASPTDIKSFRSLTPLTYKGKALAIIQPGGKLGKLTLEVGSRKTGTTTLDILTY